MASNSINYWSHYRPDTGEIYIFEANKTASGMDDKWIGYGRIKGNSPEERETALKEFVAKSYEKGGWYNALEQIEGFRRVAPEYTYEDLLKKPEAEKKENAIPEDRSKAEKPETEAQKKEEIEKPEEKAKEEAEKPKANGERTESAKPQGEKTMGDHVGGFFEEVLKGDFHEGETTISGTIGSVGVGLIPIVGQIADARDTVAAVKKVIEAPKSAGAWGGLGLAVVGWVPLFGDGIKAARKADKLIEGAGEIAEAASKRASKDVVEKGAKEAEEVIVKKQDELTQAARASEGKTDDTFEGFMTQSELDAIANDPRFIERSSKAGNFDIAGYHDLTSAGTLGRVGDKLDSDEVIQNLFWREMHNVKRTDALLKDNPAMAVPEKIHKMIKNLNSQSIKGLDAEEVLEHHIKEMKRTEEVPDFAIIMLERQAKNYLAAKGLLKSVE